MKLNITLLVTDREKIYIFMGPSLVNTGPMEYVKQLVNMCRGGCRVVVVLVPVIDRARIF